MNHHVRGISLSAAVILLSYSVSLFTPDVIASNIGRMFASATIGMSVGVEPNPYNTLALQLEEKKSELDAREGRILALEDALHSSRRTERFLAFGSLALSTCLFMLVGLNFYMDGRRFRRGTNTFAVDLRRR
jgi:hypothetical protein